MGCHWMSALWAFGNSFLLLICPGIEGVVLARPITGFEVWERLVLWVGLTSSWDFCSPTCSRHPVTGSVFDFITRFYYFLNYNYIISPFFPPNPPTSFFLSFKSNGLFFFLIIVIDGASDLPRRHNFTADSPVLWLYNLSPPPPKKSSLCFRLQELFYWCFPWDLPP